MCPQCDCAKRHRDCESGKVGMDHVCPDCREQQLEHKEDERNPHLPGGERKWLSRIVSLATPAFPAELVIRVPESSHQVLFWKILQKVMELKGVEHLIKNMHALQEFIMGMRIMTDMDTSSKLPIQQYQHWLMQNFFTYDTWFAHTVKDVDGSFDGSYPFPFHDMKRFVNPNRTTLANTFKLMMDPVLFNSVSFQNILIPHVHICVFVIAETSIS